MSKRRERRERKRIREWKLGWLDLDVEMLMEQGYSYADAWTVIINLMHRYLQHKAEIDQFIAELDNSSRK